MFGTNRKVILVTRAGLRIIPSQNKVSDTLNFPAEAVNNLEVINVERLQSLLETIFKHSSANEEFVILFNEETTFAKDLSAFDVTSLHVEAQKFVDEIPIESKVFKLYQNEKKALVLAINRKLVESLSEAADKYHAQVVAVIPMPILGFYNLNKSSDKALLNIVSKNELLPKLALTIEAPINTTVNTVKPENPNSKPFYRQTKFQLPLIIILFGLAVILILFALGFFNKPSPKVNNKQGSPSPTPTSLLENKNASNEAVLISPTPILELAKSDYRVGIMTNSESTNYAVTIKNSLTNLGYKQIEIQTINQKSTPNDTLVSFSKDLPQDLQTEITNELSKTFASIKTTQNFSDTSYEILIIFGKSRL